MAVRKSKYVVAGEAFATKAAIAARCQEILAKTAPLAPAELAFIGALLEWHERAEEKIGVGVARFWVGRATGCFHSRSFWLERCDGSQTEFSYRKCLYPPTAGGVVRWALRRAVWPQILAFRESVFEFLEDQDGTIRCELTGERIARVDAHVDHIPPRTFAFLVGEFCREEGMELAAIAVTPSQDGQAGRKLAVAGLATRWQAFHERRAVLRVVSAAANLALAHGKAAA